MKRILLLSFLFFSVAEAQPEFKPRKPSLYPQFPPEKHYAFAEKFFQEKNWKQAQAHLHPIVDFFPGFSSYNTAVFYLGCSYYLQGDLKLANRYFSQYLGLKGELPFFERVLQLKFEIAEMYRTNGHRYTCARKILPPFFANKDTAIEIYDEVIAALSNKEIAIQALFHKGMILKRSKDYEESIEVFKTLARRYEVHELAEQSFLQISEIYLARSLRESQNPDLLDLAQMNLLAFQKAFPTSPLREQVIENLLTMKEEFASSLYRTGCFYQKKTKIEAAKIYFGELLTKFPDTKIAETCRERLLAMQ